MIHFNELRISSDSKYLIIEAEIDSGKYFDKVFIDSIIIDTQDTYNPNGPSDNPVYNLNIESNQRNVRLILDYKDLGVDLDTNMFFVHIIAKGAPSPETPCGWDTNNIIGTVINLLPIYRVSMDYIRELNKSCETPKGFIDFILKFKALDLSIKTGNYLEAIKIWKKFFANIKIVPVNKCNCYGRTY